MLRSLEADARAATPEEKSVLVKYVGWGAMPQVFDDYNREWSKEREVLHRELADDEYESARSTTLNAHYTAPVVIRAMYGVLERFGFRGGRVLEPACGIGHFIGLMPEDMLRRSTVTGIEIDPLTTRIAKSLYPDSDIRAHPFEQAKLAEGFYDLAISNVPFGDYPVHDPRWNAYQLPIHDYFFAAALERVRPGGLVMFITSRGTMDKHDSTLRELLSVRTELLGAMRLPNDAFKRNAGTEVTTDIVMLRKLRPGEAPVGPSWKAIDSFTNDLEEAFTINEYFVARPEMMLGRMRLAGRMYRDGEPTLESDGRDLAETLRSAAERLPAGIYQSQDQQVAAPTLEQSIPAPDYIKPNAYCLHDGMVCIREDTVLRPLNDLPSETRARIRGLIPVRDAVRDCLHSQLDGSPEERVVENRQQLNFAYDRFVGRFGPVNGRANQRAFDGDPDLPLLLSLEHYNDETKVATKAAIFRERTIQHRQPVASAASPKEALLVTLNERGCVDLDHMAGLLARPAEDFLPDLKGLVFLNPQTRQWETDDQYLSGNVREKLAVAEAAAITDSAFAPNVEALESVQPADLAASEIDVRLGASWLPREDVERFVHDLLGVASGVDIGHVPTLGTWYVKGDWDVKRQTANTTDAEVKAIASGNPLVIEKAQVDAELMRLTRLRSAHAEEQYRIRGNLRHAHDDAAAFTARLHNLHQDIAAREDTSGDKFSIGLDGETVTNRGIAGELLIRRAEKLKNRACEEVLVGKFAGFDLFVRTNLGGDADLVLRGKNSYAARVTDTALGTIRSLEATVQGFEERSGKLDTDIADAQKRAKELEGRVGAPFERETRYQELSRRQDEIEEQLDLTKNQAPSQAESPSNDATEEATQKQSATKAIRPARRSTIRV